jgi:hypothetical protein
METSLHSGIYKDEIASPLQELVCELIDHMDAQSFTTNRRWTNVRELRLTDQSFAQLAQVLKGGHSRQKLDKNLGYSFVKVHWHSGFEYFKICLQNQGPKT